MRSLAAALALALLASASAHAQATVSPCTTFGPGSPSCPYQWAGATSVAFTGDGNGLGFVGMTTQCRADYGPGARMCRSEEVLNSDTLNLNAIPSQGCWVRPSWRPLVGAGTLSSERALDETGEVNQPAIMTCGNWKFPNGSGLALLPSGSITTASPQGPSVQCSVARPIACCKPIALGEPQASLMLPTGVGVLAMLSMMKGGA